MTTTVQPAAGSHPYPDPSVLPPDFYPKLPELYAAMAAADRAALDKWEIAVRAYVLGSRGRHAVTVAPDLFPAPRPAPVTVPDLPAPSAAIVPHGPVSHKKPKEHGLFRRHARPEPLRDQPPVRTEGFVRAPGSGTGTTPPPVPGEQDAPTLKPGELTTEDVRRATEAADEIQRQSNEALERAGAKAADLADLARPGDGRDATTEMTAVLERPADQGESK